MAWINRVLGGSEGRSASAVSFQDVYGKGLDLFSNAARTKTGLSVTQESAMQVSTVFACVRVLSDGVSTLPVDQMVRRDGVPRPARPKADWLEFRLGPWNRLQVLGQIMTSVLLDGNAYAATVRDDEGNVLWLEVLDPASVTPVRIDGGGIGFEVQVEGSGVPRLVGPMDVLHIPGMMLPGKLEGVSPIEFARETIGLSQAATEFGGAFFGNGAIPGSTIEVPGQLSETAARTIKDTWEQAHRGVGNSGRIAVLTEGAKYSKVTLSPDEAQFLQTRQFGVPDIARFFGVPLQLLSDGTSSIWGDSVQEQNIAYVQHALRPWVERIEAALSWLLVSEGRAPGEFVRLNVDGLMRGNPKDRMGVWSTAVTQGIYTINEVRRWEGMPPVEWGDEPISVQVQDDAPGEETLVEEDGAGEAGDPEEVQDNES